MPLHVMLGMAGYEQEKGRMLLFSSALKIDIYIAT